MATATVKPATKAARERRRMRIEAVRAGMFRGLRSVSLTQSLIATQLAALAALAKGEASEDQAKAREYFDDPKNFRSCLRQVEHDQKKIRDSVPAELQIAIPNAAAEIVAALDQMIASGWQAWENPRSDPIKAAAGIKIAFDALIRKARILRVDVDARYEWPAGSDPMNTARLAAQKVAALAEELRERAQERGLLSPSRAVITVAPSTGSTPTQ